MEANEMTTQSGSPATWFVGAAYGTDDQTSRFLAEGIWENGYEDKYLDLVRSMRSGDRIAIKSSYTRKHGLPFDNRGQTVSVMAIKAIGTISTLSFPPRRPAKTSLRCLILERGGCGGFTREPLVGSSRSC